MRLIHGVLFLAFLAILGTAAACSDAGDSPPAQTQPAPPAQPPPPAPPPAAPAANAGAGDPQAGAAHYKIYCATCHGETGCGDGPLSQTLDPKPAKHCDGNYMNGLSDEHLFKVVKEGGPSVGKSPQMAAWGGTLTDAQIWDIIAYVRSIADPPYKPAGG